MASREEIREQAILDLIEYKGFHRTLTEAIVDCVFKSIHPNVVIKVDRELPEPSWGVRQYEKELWQCRLAGYKDCGQDMLKAGCGFFEPLVIDS